MTYEQLLNRKQQLEFELEHQNCNVVALLSFQRELEAIEEKIKKMEENK